jgi:hypothetical protein
MKTHSSAVSVAVVSAVLALAASGVADAQAKQSITKVVVKQVQAAQAAIKASKWAECMTQLKLADAAAGKTAYDDFAVSELLGFCAIRTGDYSTAARALEQGLNSGLLAQDQMPSRVRALSQVNYQLKNYPKSIEFGNRAIKGGFADNDIYVLVAQAHYIQGDYKSTLRFVENWVEDQEKRGQTPKENALQLILSSCIKLDNTECTTRALERLVARYPKDEYWQNLMQAVLRSDVPDRVMLNVYRLASDVNSMRRADDYIEMAQLSLEAGLPGEAQSMLELALSKKIISEQRDVDRSNRLLATAKTQAATDRATLAKQEKDAGVAKTGDAEVRLGQAYLSYGMNAQGLAAIQRGIAKGGLKNAAEAQLSLGIAQMRAGNKSDAIKAFRATSGDPTLARVGSLWALHAQQ